jgi:hypothetical protein
VPQKSVRFSSTWFAFNSVSKAFPDLDLNSKRALGLRNDCLSYHPQFQNEFLFKDFLPWCANYAGDNPHVVQLYLADISSPNLMTMCARSRASWSGS